MRNDSNHPVEAESSIESDGGEASSSSEAEPTSKAWNEHQAWSWLALLSGALAAALGIARYAGWADSSFFIVLAAISGVVSLITLAMTRILESFGLRVAVTGTLAAVLGVGLVLAALAATDPDVKPEPMTGDFRIAVAEFGEVTEAGSIVTSNTAASLSESLSLFLADEAAQLAELTDDDVRIRLSTETGPIKGQDPESRAREARALAEEIDADMVLYGVLEADRGNAIFTPEFVLTGRKLDRAQEFELGHFELGSPIVSQGTLGDAQKPIRQNLEARIVAFARFVIGLTAYRNEDYKSAEEYFTEALHAETASGDLAWQDEDGRELVYLFLGNVLGEQEDLDGAEENYRTALELSDGAFARAWVGLGEVARARSGCGDESSARSIDSSTLDEAYDAYSRSETAAFQPAVSEVGAKAAYGKGRIHICHVLAMSDAGAGESDGTLEHLRGAREQFNLVVDDYQSRRTDTNPTIEFLAAESYMGLGLAQILEQPSGEGMYRQAIADYESALQLHTNNERRALIHGWLGWLYAQIEGEELASAEHCREALNLGLAPNTGLCPEQGG